MKKLYRCLTLLTCISLIFISCEKDTHRPVEIPVARLLVTNACPDITAGIDFLIDGRAVNNMPLAFTGSLGYFNVRPGDHRLQVNISGTSTILFDYLRTFAEGQVCSIFFYGKADSAKRIFVEDNLSPAVSEHAYLRFFNFTVGTPALNIGVETNTGFVPLFTGRELETDASAVSNSHFIPLRFGSYEVRLKSAGNDSLIAVFPDIYLQAGKSYTVFSNGFFGSQSIPLRLRMIQHN